MSSVNKEGLTFEEWACMARVAKFTPTTNEFIPMGEGFNQFSNCPENRNTKLVSRQYRYNYPANIRKAWADGVDPTDWAANLRRDAWMNPNAPTYGRRF